MPRIKGSSPEVEKRLVDDFPMLEYLKRSRPLEFGRLAKTVSSCAKFAREQILPKALEIDRRIAECHDYFPWDIVKEALPHGLLSRVVPRMVGGPGGLALLFALAMEELCSACAGVGNIFGAHALGIAPLLVSGSVAHWERILRPIAEGERKGEPILMAAAVTEPSAGTDVEEPHFLGKARLSMDAKRVSGGYVLNGRKCFISNGSVATYTVVCCATDRSRPLESWTTFVVHKDMEGFSVPRVEVKMGQRACPAAELLFENCFVPDENVISFEGRGMQPGTLLILAASRAPVGAIATGIARSAYEWFLKWAGRRKGGRTPISEQKIQMAIARMKTDIQLSRWAYMNAAMAFDGSLGRAMRGAPVRMLALVPRTVRTGEKYRRFFLSDAGKRLGDAIIISYTTPEDVTGALAYASLAKAVGGDTAVRVTSTALDLMGTDECEERPWLEKAFRDAKLTQIYEGTNQLNMLTLFNASVSGELRIELRGMRSGG